MNRFHYFLPRFGPTPSLPSELIINIYSEFVSEDSVATKTAQCKNLISQLPFTPGKATRAATIICR